MFKRRFKLNATRIGDGNWFESVKDGNVSLGGKSTLLEKQTLQRRGSEREKRRILRSRSRDLTSNHGLDCTHLLQKLPLLLVPFLLIWVVRELDSKIRVESEEDLVPNVKPIELWCEVSPAKNE